MKITQVKPVISEFKLMEYAGREFVYSKLVKPKYTQENIRRCAIAHKVYTGVRSKFRPVYAGNKETVIDRFSEEWV